MNKLSTYTPKYIDEKVLELRTRMIKKGYSTWSLPKYKYGYLSACLNTRDYHKALMIRPYVSGACGADNLEDMIKWIDSLPVVVPVPIQPITIPYEGEMFT